MDSAMLVALRLSKEGFGTPEAILGMPTDVVLSALEYSGFAADYEETMLELNKDRK